MKMKVDRNKKNRLIFALIMMVTGSIFFYSDDYLKPTRDELTIFYETSFNNDTIIEVVRRKYSGRGNYNVFKVDSKEIYFPILLETSNSKIYDLFKENGIVNKDKNSVELTLKVDKENFKINIRHPSDEDDRMIGLIMPIAFFGLFFIIQLFIPNSVYIKRRQRRRK